MTTDRTLTDDDIEEIHSAWMHWIPRDAPAWTAVRDILLKLGRLHGVGIRLVPDVEPNTAVLTNVGEAREAFIDALDSGQVDTYEPSQAEVDALTERTTCPSCGGSGKTDAHRNVEYPCGTCSGTGKA